MGWNTSVSSRVRPHTAHCPTLCTFR